MPVTVEILSHSISYVATIAFLNSYDYSHFTVGDTEGKNSLKKLTQSAPDDALNRANCFSENISGGERKQ